MTTYSIRRTGNVPALVETQIKSFEGLPANKDNFFLLDSAIEFIVCDCGIADGNTNKADKSGWLTTKAQRGELWNVWIEPK